MSLRACAFKTADSALTSYATLGEFLTFSGPVSSRVKWERQKLYCRITVRIKLAHEGKVLSNQ